MDAIKLTVIGGGSSYTPELADGIIKNYSTFPVKEIALVDVEEGREKVEIICSLLKRMFKKAGLPIAVYCTLDRRSALKGSHFVISQFRAGGLDARSGDEKIPLKYGIIGQETTGPGGFANALRTIPITLEICRDIEEICPDSWLINFTNPSGIVSEAVSKYSKVKCLGLCNVPINMEREVCTSLGLDKSKVQCRFAGLNHLSFIGRIFVDGRDILESRGGSRLIKNNVVKNIKGSEIPSEFVDALGFIPSPYLKYFYLESDMFKEEFEKYNAGGITRADEVKEVESVLFDKYRDVSLNEKPEELSKRGGALYSEAAVSLMNSIWNDASDIHVVNTTNRGCIPDLPRDAVIETNCVISRSGAEPLVYGPLPDAVKGLVQQVKAYERLTVEAAVEGSQTKAILALVNNPLVLDANKAQAIFADILRANAPYLKHFLPEASR